MPTPTYVAIAKNLLTSNQASVTFSGIPSTYTDLLLTFSVRTAAADYQATLTYQFNSTTGNYSETYLRANFASVSSSRDSNQTKAYGMLVFNGDTSTSNTFSSGEIYIPNYAGSTNKVLSMTGVNENNNANQNNIVPYAGLWSNTAAITSIKIEDYYGNNLLTGSRFDLYGIKNS
jgi:hypothetical protein